MEKASKWIQNFLLGKRDHHQEKKKDEKISVSSSSSSLFAVAVAADQTPEVILHSKEKRRWSFKKSSATTDKVIISHKTNRSFDEIYTADRLVKQALPEQDIEQIRMKKALLLEPSNNNNNNNNNSNEANRRSRADLMPIKYAAAIKIQSVFRSYLARRALRALRALVKLQALVRGHRVRKQTNAVLRCMHSLMTIQVRARFKRLQMADPDPDADDEHHHHPNNNYIIKTTVQLQPQKLQPLTTNDKINESSMQQRRRSTSKNKSHRTQLLGSPVVAPTYMSDTESSKAKNRSQSEPKRRPIPKGWSTREKSSRRRSSTSTTEEGLRMCVPLRDDQQQNMQYPWLFKLYRSAKPGKESQIHDSASATTYNSNYYATPFEQPPVNLY